MCLFDTTIYYIIQRQFIIIQTESVRRAAALNNILLELIGRVGIERLYRWNNDSGVFFYILIIFFWSRFRCQRNRII
jgi:hypothetical protein